MRLERVLTSGRWLLCRACARVPIVPSAAAAVVVRTRAQEHGAAAHPPQFVEELARATALANREAGVQCTHHRRLHADEARRRARIRALDEPRLPDHLDKVLRLDRTFGCGPLDDLGRARHVVLVPHVRLLHLKEVDQAVGVRRRELRVGVDQPLRELALAKLGCRRRIGALVRVRAAGVERRPLGVVHAAAVGASSQLVESCHQ
eukprot:5231399-Prymnesium_polylepis.3